MEEGEVMRERPLLCTDEEALAVREGRQTEDRRPVKAKDPWMPRLEGGREMTPALLESGIWAWCKEGEYVGDIGNPPWQPGDLLYVREAHSLWTERYNEDEDEDEYEDEVWPACTAELVRYRASPRVGRRRWTSGAPIDGAQASPHHVRYLHESTPLGRAPGPCTWRSSRHMPKWAARTWVEVTDVRVERVQNIDYAGARAEGCDTYEASGTPSHIRAAWAINSFARLWDRRYKSRGFGWDSNPWVWVTRFRRVTR
jgi:hypothetical protein